RPMASLATTRYWSAVPIQWGRHAIHYSLHPRAEASRDAAAAASSADYLAEELADRLRRGAVTYDFQIQFYRDPRKTPIEDASVEWKEEDAPFVTVGRLTLPQQDPTAARGQR